MLSLFATQADITTLLRDLLESDGIQMFEQTGNGYVEQDKADLKKLSVHKIIGLIQSGKPWKSRQRSINMKKPNISQFLTGGVVRRAGKSYLLETQIHGFATKLLKQGRTSIKLHYGVIVYPNATFTGGIISNGSWYTDRALEQHVKGTVWKQSISYKPCYAPLLK